MDEALRSNAEREQRNPRTSVVAALDALDLRSGMALLDAGCGPGAHLGLFAERVSPGGSVTGMDLSAERIEVARAVNGALVTNGSVQLREGDLAALPWDAPLFDVVWSSAVLHHVDEPVAVLREFRRVTRPGGLVAVLETDSSLSFPLLPWPPAFEAKLRAATLRADLEDEHGGDLHLLHGYIGRMLPRLLREAGLHDVQLRLLSDIARAPLTAERDQALRHWISGSFANRLRPYLAPRDMQQYEAYIDPESEDYLLGSPDFFMARTYVLVTGRVE